LIPFLILLYFLGGGIGLFFLRASTGPVAQAAVLGVLIALLQLLAGLNDWP
jgi:type III secretory pathway component EscS